MATLKLTDFVLYRWRYIVSYIALALLLVALLYATGLFAPGGISSSEMTSAVRTQQLGTEVLYGQQPDQLIHLPYRLLQIASIELFGLTALSLKLPSLILAGVATIGFYGLLSLWFRRNTAVISTVILITSGQFLLQSQQATPAILYLFWGVGLLFATSMLSQATRLRPVWLIAASVIGALSLYTPLQVYAIGALLLTSLIHPHARFIIFRQPVWAIAVSSTLFTALLVPLILGVVTRPVLGLQLLGIPDHLTAITLTSILEQLGQYVSFHQPSTTTIITPVYGLGILLLLLLGITRLFSAKYTAKSYILTLWIVFILPIIALNPNAVWLTLLPVMIFVAFAIDYLIRSWYQLFPRNPYARIAGLLPLGVLLVGLSVSGVEQFVYGYQYDPRASSVYRNDLSLLQETVSRYPDENITLTVPDKQRAFFALYASHEEIANLTVVSDISAVNTPGSGVVISLGQGGDRVASVPTYIVTSSTKDEGNRLYVYENSAS